MPADLVGGSYHLYNPIWTALGRPANTNQANIAVRTNLYYLGASTIVDSATAATKKGIFAAIPVEPGDVISKVSVAVGATEGETITASFTAIYAGLEKEGLVLGQSTSKAENVVKEKLWTQELKEKVEITTTNAPFGYIYAGLFIEGTTIPTLAGWNIKPKAGYAYFKGAPVWATEITTKEAKVAGANTGTPTMVEKVPLIFVQ